MTTLARTTLALCAVAALAALAACGDSTDDTQSNTAFTSAVIGDMPYGLTPTDTTQLALHPKFIAALNADTSLANVLHVGDIHSGKSYCTEAFNQTIASHWKQFKLPLIYTPGDNEWADCHKPGEGGGSYDAATKTIKYVLDANGQPASHKNGDPVANLALVRSTFFPKAGQTQGGVPISVHSQANEFNPAYPADKAFVENVWFMKSRVLVVTLNIPGGSNNGDDNWWGTPTQSAAQKDEIAARTGATLRWLDTAFAQAKAANAVGVVIQTQADMWDADGKPMSHLTGYKPYVDKVAALTKDFAKPVLMLNGDSHLYRSDNPLQTGAACVVEPATGGTAAACANDPAAAQPGNYNVPNFRRIVVHGSTAPMEYLKLTVDPLTNAANGVNAFGPFKWSRIAPAL